MLVTQSCPTLCNPMDCRPPGFSVDGILQARRVEWVAIPMTRGSSQHSDEPGFPHCRQIILYLSHQKEILCLAAQSCPTLCDPMDCRPPGFSVHGIPQARILEWVARLSSRGSFSPSIEYVMSPLAGGFFTTRATWETQIDELKDIS